MSFVFQHFFLTRFNIATPGREFAIRNRPGWLEERFDLFERYCLPSMRHQINQNFKWIIFFDEDTPAQYRSRIEECRKVREFHPYFTGLFEARGWGDAVASVVEGRCDYLITTRLDNDDALCENFVEQLHKKITATELEGVDFLNFTKGYVVQGAKIYALKHRTNAFVSRIEKYEEHAETVCVVPHMDVENLGRVRQVDSRSGTWIQVVHGGNVSNRVRGQRIIPKNIIEPLPIGIRSQLHDVSYLQISIENIVVNSVRAVVNFVASKLSRFRGSVR